MNKVASKFTCGACGDSFDTKGKLAEHREECEERKEKLKRLKEKYPEEYSHIELEGKK